MIVTSDDLESGRLCVLPVGWQKLGSADDAVRELGQPSSSAAKPSYWKLAIGADSDRGILICVISERRHNRWALKTKEGSPTGEIATEEVACDFDVVDRKTSAVLVEIRHAAEGEALKKVAHLEGGP